nr:zinc finger, CCHC-type [Tanacetum cinerariifolium]
MHFMLSSMSVVYVLTTLMLDDGGENPTMEQARKRTKMLKLLNSYGIPWKPNIWLRMPQVSCIIDKLPSLWKDFKHTLKHLKDELTLIELCSHLRIKESLTVQDSDKPKGNNVTGPSVVNTVKHSNSSKYNDKGLNTVSDNIGSSFMSTSKLNNSILWHARLGHVHFKRMQDMSKDGLIPAIDIDTEKSCYLLNRVPNKRNMITLYELWTKKKSKLNYLSIWGCREAARLLDPKLKTLGKRGIECIFVGYAEHSKAFRFHVIKPNDSVPINSIIESRDDIFDEQRFSFVPRPSQRSVVKGTKDSGRIDYFDTYAPMARISTIRLLIPMACIHNMIIYRMNVKTAFLNRELEKEVDLTKEFLSSRFSMKDTGEAYVILGVRIKHESNGIAISQSHYIEKVLKKFNYSDCTPISTHLDTCEKLMPNRGLALSRYTCNPGTQHWQAIQRVLKYLKITMDYRLVYCGYPSVLEGYTDASWISNTKDNSSTSGWVFLLGGGAISWDSKKQTCITGSTMESKFVALAAAGKKAEWLKNLLLEIPLWVKPITHISIRCDSAATLEKAYSHMYNGKSRHLGVRHSMIRELITNEVVSIEFVRSQQNLVDHLTKGLAKDLVIKSTEGMGLKSI